ncbi:ABC transporter ATP-binding protein [Almyronema epifaneia S1]|uniref:ABC transporter ATP-binding protein n=2 Tax=Almyronema TaxID=3114804 RepID=A0ABW6IFK4_9CYAN
MRAAESSANGEKPLLTAVDLSFTYIGQTQPTLKAANLTLQAGELIVIAGATGSGKSTLLNCLTGIAPEYTGGQLTGEVFYRQCEITSWSIRQRSQFMGILLQNVEVQLFTDRVWDEIVFGLENWNLPPGEMQTLTQTALHQFDLVAQQNWAIRQLSAGQKQRLLLACLLTRQQSVLLLDEPFAYLDTAGVDRLLALLKHCRDRGQAILVIEHRLELLQPICDRAYRIQSGEIAPWHWPRSLATAMPPPPAPARRLATHTAATNQLLQTQNLSWGGYPAFPDLQAGAGAVILLKGPNGCGKTTLLRLLSGLLKPTTGLIKILGQDTRRQSVVQIAQTVGFVLQNPNHQLFAESVWAEVKQPGVAANQANTLLEQLNLSPCLEQHPQALSQGQKRRLALAAVLSRQPRICLLDEIMVGQDAASLALMLQALKTFTQQGGALIFTSHDPGVAEILQPQIVAIGGSQL